MTKRRVVRWLAIAALAACGACNAKEDRTWGGRVIPLTGARLTLVELSEGSLAAVSLDDAGVLWRYQPMLHRSSYLDFADRYRLVCPVIETAAGDLLLRYDRELHVVSRADGALKWKLYVYRWAQGELRCPTATADSGVLLVRKNGLVVDKFAHDGKPAWRYRLFALGAAVSPPVVSQTSGDILVQTTSHLVALSPSGALNWALDRGALAAAPEPATVDR